MITTTVADAQEILTDLAALLATAYQGLDESTAWVREFFEKANKPIDLGVAASLVRWRMRDFLDARGHDVVNENDDNCEYGREPLGNNGLSVVCRGKHVRILRSNKWGIIPTAGPSRVRQAFYRQQYKRQMYLEFPNLEQFVGPVIMEPIDLNLLLIWFTTSDYSLSGLMLVCPEYGAESPSSLRIHWAEPVPHPATQLGEVIEADAERLPIDHPADESDEEAGGGEGA